MKELFKDAFKDLIDDIDKIPAWAVLAFAWVATRAVYFNYQYNKAEDELNKLTNVHSCAPKVIDTDKEELCRKQSADYVFKDGKCYIYKNISNQGNQR